jgi:hypothetical protein
LVRVGAEVVNLSDFYLVEIKPRVLHFASRRVRGSEREEKSAGLLRSE